MQPILPFSSPPPMPRGHDGGDTTLPFFDSRYNPALMSNAALQGNLPGLHQSSALTAQNKSTLPAAPTVNRPKNLGHFIKSGTHIAGCAAIGALMGFGLPGAVIGGLIGTVSSRLF